MMFFLPLILLPTLISHIFGFPFSNVPTNNLLSNKSIYLTFDADMTPRMEKNLASGKVASWYSPGLVTYLEAQHIPSTFFITGLFAEIYPDLVKELGANPDFAIENHTYDHAAFEPRCYRLTSISSDTDKLDEMTRTQSILENLTHQSPHYLRHPGLCHNQHDDALAKQIDLKVSDTGIISADAFAKNSNQIVRTVEKGLSKNVSTTIIFHLGGPNAPATEQAIKILIPLLKKEGYTFIHL